MRENLGKPPRKPDGDNEEATGAGAAQHLLCAPLKQAVNRQICLFWMSMMIYFETNDMLKPLLCNFRTNLLVYVVYFFYYLFIYFFFLPQTQYKNVLKSL